MSRVPDRKKQRREYLKKKGQAYSMGIVLILMALFFLIHCLKHLLDPFDAIEAIVLLLCAGWFAKQLKHVQERARIPYVPPVTAETLPAEEVLVRGSEELQQAQSEVLVRPATREQETPAQELLRSSQGGTQG